MNKTPQGEREVTTHDWPAHPAADLFPMLDDTELKELADDIAAHGLREPVWLWRDHDDKVWLLDGRNRVRACEVADVEVRTRWYVGDDPTEFAVSLNLRRRHLTTGQKAALAYKLMPLYEAEARRRQAEAVAERHKREAEQKATERAAVEPELPANDGDDVSLECADLHTLDEATVEPEPALDLRAKKPKRSADQAAKAAGVSARAAAQYKRIREAAPDLADKVDTGVLALDRAERVIRDREAEQRRIEQARAEAAAGEVRTIVDIRHGDFREVLPDLENIDAIITDPPYPHEFIPLLGDLAAFADKVLAPNGVLAVLIGQTYLPEVYRLLDTGRPYRWTGCYLTPGNGYASHKARVQSNWKPLIVYGGGPRFADIIRSEGTDAAAKSNHRWGQDYAAFHTIIERLTARGETVVDPFMGSGTTLLAAHALGRHAIGCDIEDASVARARERLT